MASRQAQRARRILCVLAFFVVFFSACSKEPENRWRYVPQSANSAPKLKDKIDFLEERLKSRPRAFLEMAELAGLYLQRGKARRDESDVEKALAWVDKSLGEFENAPALLVKVDALQMEHRFPEALEVLEKALSLEKGNAKGLILETRVHLAMGDAEKARASFEKLPESQLSSFRFLQARVEEESGNLEEAERLYTAALAGEADIASSAEAARRRAVFARAKLRSGDLDEAEALLSAALVIPVDQPLAQLLKARLELARENWSEAADTLRAGYEIYRDPLFLVELGEAEKLAGKEEAAQRSLETAVKLLRVDSFGHERDLALALHRLGAEENAQEIQELMTAELARRQDRETLRIAEIVGVK